MPDYTTELAVMRQMMGSRDGLVVFAERLALVNGIALTDPAALVARLRENKWLHGYCDPALWPALAPYFGADFKVETTYDRKRVDDYAFGITRAVGAIAETGTIVLNARSFWRCHLTWKTEMVRSEAPGAAGLGPGSFARPA